MRSRATQPRHAWDDVVRVANPLLLLVDVGLLFADTGILEECLWWPVGALGAGMLSSHPFMAHAHVQVLLVTHPETICCEADQWSRAARFVRQRLRQRYAHQIVIDEVQAFTERFQQFPDAVAALAADPLLPAVLVQGKVVAQGGKLHFRAIEIAVRQALSQPGD
ncbi:MAG: hypothetical protein MUF01_12665 [Bryobacterales bacterium]|jgi:hypothetical protein|nr:hypothetical protein [Bryobacterales bacterium]